MRTLHISGDVADRLVAWFEAHPDLLGEGSVDDNVLRLLDHAYDPDGCDDPRHLAEGTRRWSDSRAGRTEMTAVEGRCRVEVTEDGSTKITGLDEHMAGVHIVIPPDERPYRVVPAEADAPPEVQQTGYAVPLDGDWLATATVKLSRVLGVSLGCPVTGAAVCLLVQTEGGSIVHIPGSIERLVPDPDAEDRPEGASDAPH